MKGYIGTVFVVIMLVAGLVMVFGGCGKKAPATPAATTTPSASPSTTAATPATAPAKPPAAVGKTTAPAAGVTPAGKVGAKSSGMIQELATDPVSGARLAKSKMMPYDYKGKTYYFVSEGNLKKFKSDPAKYAAHPAHAFAAPKYAPHSGPKKGPMAEPQTK